MNDLIELQQPVIGITIYGTDRRRRFSLPVDYVTAVRKSCGIPVLLPPVETEIETLLDILHGIVFTGGGDLDPAFYQGQHHPAIAEVDRERDRFELALAEKVLESSMPVLGICRGMQLLNVASGGTLIEDIPTRVGSQVVHREGDEGDARHPVEIEPKSRLAEILGSEPLDTLSKHHQAVDRVAGVWQITARAPDGVIEAMEHRTHPWMIAVQWHPEMTIRNNRHFRLFEALVSEAAKYRKGDVAS